MALSGAGCSSSSSSISLYTNSYQEPAAESAGGKDVRGVELELFKFFISSISTLMRNFKIHDLHPEGYPHKGEHAGPLLPTCGVTLFHVNVCV